MPVIGTQVTFQVTVVNAGPNPVQRIVVRDRLPGGYAYVSHQVTRGAYTPGNGQWKNFGLSAAGSAGLTIVATVKPSGNRVNVAEILSSTSADPDSTPGNANPAEDDYASRSTTPTPPNVAPVITGQVVLGTPEDTSLTITLAALTVTDPDDVYPSDFTLSVQSGTGYTLTGVNEITPDADFNGALTVPVVVNDGTDSSAPFGLQVTVTAVNDAPVITAQGAMLATAEQTPLTITLADLTVDDADDVYPDDFTLGVQPGTSYALTGVNEITPDADFNGALTVLVTVNDGTDSSAPFGLQVSVTAVNDAPVITGQVVLGTAQQTPLTIALADLTVDDADDVYPDDFTLAVQSGTGYTLTGVNEITPDADFNGALTVPVVVNDGTDSSAPFGLQVSVTAVNDAPVITGQVVLGTAQQTPLTITLADLTVDDADDVYPDDFTLAVQSGTGYTLTGVNEITPDADFNGALTVPVVVNDGTGSSAPFDLLVTVTPVNDAPVIAASGTLITRKETPLTITLADLTVNDSDNLYPTDFSLTVQPGTSYTLTGMGEITPAAGFVGALTVAVTVNDGSEDSAVFDVPVTVTGQNIIVVMVDDLDSRSLDDLLNAGLMPNLQTHFIDRGITFPESYATDPFCCPSRATFLTGQYAHNHGIVNNQLLYDGFGFERAVGKFDDSVTLPTRLQGLGYTTGYFGKYLNGYGVDAALTFLSPAFDPHYVPPGWTSWNGLVDLSTYCVYDYTINHDGVLVDYLRPPGQTEDSATYQTNMLATLSESFVLAHKDDAAPFFLTVMPLAPHGERCPDAYEGPPPTGENGFDLHIRPAPEDKTAAVPTFVPTPAYDEDLADKPSWLSSLPPLSSIDIANIPEQYTGRLRAMLSVDRLLGRLVTALGDRLEETVLVFTSDNGWLYGEHRRAGKIYAYRESARVPLYIAVPGSTPELRPDLVLNNDLAPTILDLVAPGHTDPQSDGRSLVPILQAAEPPGWTDRAQFLIEFGRVAGSPSLDLWPTYFALRTPTTMYIESYGGTYYSQTPPPLIGLELYDLANDPAEMNSLLHHPQNARDPVLGPWLDLLRGCGGGTCEQYENLQPAP